MMYAQPTTQMQMQQPITQDRDANDTNLTQAAHDKNDAEEIIWSSKKVSTSKSERNPEQQLSEFTFNSNH